MPKQLSDSECKEIIRRLEQRLGVDPALIVTRLMDESDKQDMRDGNLPVKSLECHIKVWKKAGYPDYAHGKDIPLAIERARESN